MTKTKFYNELDIPSKSVMIIHGLMTDKRLGKTAKARLTVSYVYGLLRRTFNLSLNSIKYHYSKKYNTIYLINRISTLVDRSGLNQRTIRRALNILNKYGYINRFNNRVKHLTYISLPLVIQSHIKSKTTAKVVSKFMAPDKNDGGTGQNVHSHRTKMTEAPDKINSRCNGSYLNGSYLNGSCCNVRDSAKASPQNNSDNNKRTKGNSNDNINLINSWANNTVNNNLGINQSVVDTIKQYLLNNSKSYKLGSSIVRNIMTAKNKVNMKLKGISYTKYYRDETNPYIQGDALIKTLKKVFKHGLNLKDQVKSDYYNYLMKHADKLTLKRNGKSLGHEDGVRIDRLEKTKQNIISGERAIRIYKKYLDNPDCKRKYKDAKHDLKLDKDYWIKNSDEPIRYIKGTTEHYQDQNPKQSNKVTAKAKAKLDHLDKITAKVNGVHKLNVVPKDVNNQSQINRWHQDPTINEMETGCKIFYEDIDGTVLYQGVDVQKQRQMEAKDKQKRTAKLTRKDNENRLQFAIDFEPNQAKQAKAKLKKMKQQDKKQDELIPF